MSKVKLNQIVALNAPKKGHFEKMLTAVYHRFQKAEPFYGVERTYTPKDADGEQLPNESSRVQFKVEDVLKEVQESWKEMFDVILTNDRGNAEAKSDVIVDDMVILKEVPVSTLIFLEKQLENWKNVISKLPTLTLTDNWTFDSNIGMHITDFVQTIKTKKEQRPIVLYDATKEHPAQTNLITEDVTVGHWKTKKISSALPVTKADTLLKRVMKIKEAVIKAREHANSLEIEQQKGGEEILKFLFE